MEKPSQANKFMFFLMIYMVFIQVFMMVFVEYILPFEIDIDTYRKYIILFGHIFMFGIPILLCCLAKNIRLGDLIPHEKVSPLTMVLTIFIAFFTIIMIGAVGVVTQLFADTSEYREADEFISSFSFGYMFVSTAVMPAIFEELTFRGVIMTCCKRAGIVKAVLLSALYFGIMHMSLYQLFYAIAAGLIFGVMVYYSNSILTSVTAHFIVNGTQVAVSFISDKISGMGSYVPETAFPEEITDLQPAQIAGSVVFLLLISVPPLVGLLYAFIQLNKGKEIDYKYSLTAKHEFEADLLPDKKRDRVFDAFFVFVLIFYAGYILLESYLANA